MLRLGKEEAALLREGAAYGEIAERLQEAIEAFSDKEIAALDMPRIAHVETSSFYTTQKTQTRLKVLAAKLNVRVLDVVNAIIREHYGP